MPKWSDCVKMIEDKGAPHLQLYVSVSSPLVPFEQLLSASQDHIDYQKKLEKEGKLAFSGPLSDEAGDELADGMTIYRAGSLEEARGYAEGDPMHALGLRKFVLRKWLVCEASLKVAVTLEGQKVTLS